MIEQQRLFLHRLDDRLKEFEPADPLFIKKSLTASSILGSPMSLAAPQSQGPTVSVALEAYLKRSEKFRVKKTHAARVWQLRYLEEFLGAERPLSTVTSHEVRAPSPASVRTTGGHPPNRFPRSRPPIQRPG